MTTTILDIWHSENDRMPWQKNKTIYQTGTGMVVIENFQPQTNVVIPFEKNNDDCLELLYNISGTAFFQPDQQGLFATTEMVSGRRALSWSSAATGLFELEASQPVKVIHIYVPRAKLPMFFHDQNQLERFIGMSQPKQCFYGLVNSIDATVESIIHQILNNRMQEPLRGLFIEAKVLELLTLEIELWLETKSQDSLLLHGEVQLLNLARDILLKEYQEPPSIKALSRQVGLSEKKLKQGFRHLYNNTIYSTVKKQRMAQAKLLFDCGKANVSEAAVAVGYSNFSHFSKAFSEEYGIKPSLYLKNCYTS